MTDVKEPDIFTEIWANLARIGYEGDLIQEDYAFRDFLFEGQKTGSAVRRVPLAAFGQWPPSYRNACIGVIAPEDASAAAIKPFRALGAPQVLALHPKEQLVRRWKIGATGDPKQLEPFEFGEITSTFQLHEKEWGPARILEARTLAPADASAQLDFFDSGLLPALESLLRVRLERDIQQIMQRCKDMYAQQYPNLSFDSALAPVFRLVFRLIAAKMLIDRGNQTTWKELNASDVIKAVDAFYFRNETPEPVLQNAAVQEAVWQQVLSGLDLQNLSVETLAYLYENAFVTEKLRRDQSIHATPPEVAEYLIRQLPIDKLAYADRRIFEPFTGHAPFLTAGLRRLRELLPKDISPQERHEYFVDMLSGMENEPFAREIARYALILADYPNPDGWRIRDANVFTSPEFDQMLQHANIVLCNPPYGDFTSTERSTIGNEAAFTKEVEALRHVLAQRPKMFGFILPNTFLTRSDFRELRIAIASHYKSVSITVLPPRMFSKTSQEVAVIAAHNVDLPSAPYSYSMVPPAEKTEFKRTGKPLLIDNYTKIVYQNSDVDFRRMPLQSVWKALASSTHLDSLVEVHRGIEYKPEHIVECVSHVPFADAVPGIQTRSGYFEAYVVPKYQYLSTNMEKMDRNVDLQAWKQSKVIINRARSSQGYWRIAGAVDEQGLAFSRQFYALLPINGMHVEIIAAIINGPVANAYLKSYLTGRDNYQADIKQIPVPSFTEEQMQLIVSLVQDYYSQRGQWLAAKHLAAHFEAKCRKLLYQIDATVLEAYALPTELEIELLRAFDNVPRRPLPFKFLGYGDDYERAKVELQQEKAFRNVLSRYHKLVDKEFLDGITDAELDEQERLRQQIDAYNAPFYEPIIAALEAGKL